MIESKKIDFIGIGSGKSGTSWLAEMLRQHPAVNYPKARKELHYFNPVIPIDYATANHQNTNSYEWYHSFFDFKSEEKIRGEITPCYLDIEGSEKLIRNYNPEIRLFVILRNPFERIISQYTFAKSNGIERSDSIENAILANEKKYLDSSLYHQHLARYLKYFNRDQLGIFFYEDLQHDEKSFFNDICNFLQIPAFTPTNISAKINEGSTAKHQNLMFMVGQFRKTLHKTNNSFLIDSFKSLKKTKLFSKLMAKENGSTNSSPVISSNLHRRLTEYWGNDILKLSAMVDRDLTNWTKK